MLFNSYIFVFLFLPFTLFVFFNLGRQRYYHAAIVWLTATSLFFYGWWNSNYLFLILISILFNYTVGSFLSGNVSTALISAKALFVLGIVFNLALLGYFKYTIFFVNNLNYLTGTHIQIEKIVLPLGISFFTFQQIAYLADAYKGETGKYRFLHYCLFVSFFPQLIAGPIVHHKEIMPQFSREDIYHLNYEHLAVGLTIFSIGLFKKVMIADTAAVYATPVFNAAASGSPLFFADAWRGALAYTFQLYFDFSGYSDMAVGLGRMMGITLPVNFNSPYKAINIIDFWRRWHITLSHFLRDYLYIPLGGNRKGGLRRYINLMITMFLGGLWHGAGWTFVIWGILHGVYLVINNLWISLRHLWIKGNKKSGWAKLFLSRILTFLAVVVAWVFFRAENVEVAIELLRAMTGANGLFPESYSKELTAACAGLSEISLSFNKMSSFMLDMNELMNQFKDVIFDIKSFLFLGLLFLIVQFAPNTQQMMERYDSGLKLYDDDQKICSSLLQWNPSLIWAIIFTVISFINIMAMSSATEFLYFNF